MNLMIQPTYYSKTRNSSNKNNTSYFEFNEKMMIPLKISNKKSNKFCFSNNMTNEVSFKGKQFNSGNYTDLQIAIAMEFLHVKDKDVDHFLPTFIQQNTFPNIPQILIKTKLDTEVATIKRLIAEILEMDAEKVRIKKYEQEKLETSTKYKLEN